MDSKQFELSVIIPTYNEIENIALIIGEIEKVFSASAIKGELVIADDDSPDGTAAVARSLNETFGNIQVLVRTVDKGLSAAIIDGFKIARSDHFLVMDADLSHPPEIIPRLFAPLQKKQAQLVFGCRYMKGGGVTNWTWKRRIISKSASLLAKAVTRIKDPMSGLFALHRGVAEGVIFHPKGFKIGLEIVAKGNYESIIEVPYFFCDRRFGTSKLDSGVIKDYLQHLSLILFAQNSVFSEFLKFSLVGLTGLLMNLAVLYYMVEKFPYWRELGHRVADYKVLISAAAAFCLAANYNFLLNRFWVFRKQQTRISPFILYRSYLTIVLGGLTINMLLLYFLHYRQNMWYLPAQIIAICAAALWNFIGNKIRTFKNG